jgi:integral membrane sensor domain MASE1
MWVAITIIMYKATLITLTALLMDMVVTATPTVTLGPLPIIPNNSTILLALSTTALMPTISAIHTHHMQAERAAQVERLLQR